MPAGSGPLIPNDSIKTAVGVLGSVFVFSFTAQLQPPSIATSSVIASDIFAIFNNLAFWATAIGLLLQVANVNATTDAATYSLTVVSMACEAAAFVCAGFNNNSSATSRGVCVAIAVIVCSTIFAFLVYSFFCRRRLGDGNAATVPSAAALV